MMEPWRFRCIECGSTQLRYRVTHGRDTIKGGNVADNPYYCDNCGEGYDKRLDAKTGKEVA